MKGDPQSKIFITGFEFIIRVVLFAEGNDGFGAKPMAFFRADWNLIFVKCHSAVIAVADLEHEAWDGQDGDFQTPLTR